MKVVVGCAFVFCDKSFCVRLWVSCQRLTMGQGCVVMQRQDPLPGQPEIRDQFQHRLELLNATCTTII